jgi:hypothetical protein
MKTVYTLITVCALVLCCATRGSAQATGDFRSNGTGGGKWSVLATWQTYNGSTWVAASAAPTGNHVVTLRSTDSVNVDVAVTITDTLKNQGILTGGSNLTIANGGVFQHDRDAGSLPLATWNTGSTLLLTGTTSTAPDNRNQNFSNVAFNTPGLSSNLSMSWDSVTIGGNVSVINTGTSRWYLTTAVASDSTVVTLMGDVIVSGGQFSTNGTSNANTKFVIHQYGNIVVTGGNLSISRGSQGSGTGSTRWYLHGGNFSMTNGTTQNSNAANAWFVFDKAGTQLLTLGSGNTLTALPIEVKAGTRLDLGMSKLRGSGLFTVNPGAMIITALDGGIDSAVSVTGTVTTGTQASFMFNGSTAQVTGLTMPATVDTLAINNPAGVKLSRATTINGRLRLMAGVFDNTIPFTLGTGATISFEGGSLLVTAVAEEPGIPRSFFVDQNYPNPFNPTTTVRYGLPHEAFVAIAVYNLLGQEVARVVPGLTPAGIHSAVLDAAKLSTGAYFYTVRAGASTVTRRMMVVK